MRSPCRRMRVTDSIVTAVMRTPPVTMNFTEDEKASRSMPFATPRSRGKQSECLSALWHRAALGQRPAMAALVGTDDRGEGGASPQVTRHTRATWRRSSGKTTLRVDCSCPTEPVLGLSTSLTTIAFNVDGVGPLVCVTLRGVLVGFRGLHWAAGHPAQTCSGQFSPIPRR